MGQTRALVEGNLSRATSALVEGNHLQRSVTGSNSIGASELAASLVSNDATRAGIGSLSMEDFTTTPEREEMSRYFGVPSHTCC